jgi:hypothetical protein
MAQSISARIYEAFFAKLSETEEVSPETIAALRGLYSAGRLDNKQQIKRLMQDMEQRHAQDQESGN